MGDLGPDATSLVVCFVPTLDRYLIASIAPDAVSVRADDGVELEQAVLDFQAACWLFHVDLTFGAETPPRRLSIARAIAALGGQVWNADAIDVSKRKVQAAVERLGLPSTRLSPDHSGLVIVKTDLNCGGTAERRMATGRAFPAAPYEVLERGALPDAWLHSAAIVVERYVTNPEGTFYRVYRCGRQVVVCRSLSHDVIKKMGYGKPRFSAFFSDDELLSATAPVHPELTCGRNAILVMNRLGVQFGAADLVEDERANQYVIDVNHTPYWDEHEPEIEAFLRRGLPSGNTKGACATARH